MYRPEPGWLAASSYVEPVVPPAVEPDSSPGVQVCFSASWLPYVLGSLQQMCQPTAWDTSDPAVLQTTLDRAQALLELFGTAGACMLLRWSDADCALEQSSDGGVTWTAITGWDINGLAACLQTPLIDIGGTAGTGANGPYNPGGLSTAQVACNIANWLAIEILQGSMSSLAGSLGALATTLETADALFGLAASFTGVGGLFFEAAGLFIAAGTAIGETALNTAASDATLRGDIICAIYEAIRVAGKVTTGNFATILANINAISYGTPGIVGLIRDYVSNLGYVGLNALQSEGALYGGSCSGCANPPSGCTPFIPTVIGSTTTYTWTGPHAGQFNKASADDEYAGCYAGLYGAGATWSIQATMQAGVSALGMASSHGTHGMPNAGDNNWVNDVDAAILWNSGVWTFLLFGAGAATGSLGSIGDTISISYDPATAGGTIRAFIAGTEVAATSGVASSYFPVIYGVHTGDRMEDVQVCT